jgi:Fe2+ transport system protein FeoA
LARGEWAEIVSVEGDMGWANRCAELGLRPGCRVQMLEPGCPCLFSVGGARLCLRLGEHVQVLVQPLASAGLVIHEVA